MSKHRPNSLRGGVGERKDWGLIGGVLTSSVRCSASNCAGGRASNCKSRPRSMGESGAPTTCAPLSSDARPLPLVDAACRIRNTAGGRRASEDMCA
eukprot:scaffold43037_cov28-Tisochrysis_lutea.AAC.6